MFVFSTTFKKDILSLKKEDSKLGFKIFELLTDIETNISTPLLGIGKPELLRNNMKGYYSRRITDKHRLIYTIKNEIVYLISCYGHYDDK